MEPKISIIIISSGRPSLYRLIKKLLGQKINYDFEILLVSSTILNVNQLRSDRIRIIHGQLGMGFAFYRNVGIKNSRGNILVFIDDDEEPFDSHWLMYLTDPIIKGDKVVVTSGYDIPCGNGYVADSISHLGFPGGGCLGFKTMWNVNDQEYTNHLCTGNFAITREILEKIGAFNEDLKYGSEDDELSRRLSEKSIGIKYVEHATVYHHPRRNLSSFLRWQIRRGKAMYDLNNLGSSKQNYAKSRLLYPKKILKKSYLTKYFMMVLLLILLQYLCRIIGYMSRAIESTSKGN